jgi:hypothetical protein
VKRHLEWYAFQYIHFDKNWIKTSVAFPKYEQRVFRWADHLNVSYLYKKRGVFYFTKRVPCDVKSYYKNDRIVICLRT